MFRVRDLKNGFYQVHQEDGEAYEGTPGMLFKKAIELGIVEKELVKAVVGMGDEDFDYTDFDDYGYIIAILRN